MYTLFTLCAIIKLKTILFDADNKIFQNIKSNTVLIRVLFTL